jgi:hypothetical protein
MSNLEKKLPNGNPMPAKAESKSAERKPNDTGSVIVQAHMKIFDPVNKQVFVEGRA